MHDRTREVCCYIHSCLNISQLSVSRGKSREKMLERELAKIVGENWQVRQNAHSSHNVIPIILIFSPLSTYLHLRQRSQPTLGLDLHSTANVPIPLPSVTRWRNLLHKPLSTQLWPTSIRCGCSSLVWKNACRCARRSLPKAWRRRKRRERSSRK